MKREDEGGTYCGDFSLSLPVVHAAVDGRSRIAVQRGAPAFAAEMDVHGEEDVLAIQSLERGSQRLAARGPCGSVLRVDSAWVVLQFGAGKGFIGVGAGARIRVPQAHDRGVVEVRDADVAPWLATVAVVYRVDIHE